MTLELNENLNQMKEIVKELFIFTNQLESIRLSGIKFGQNTHNTEEEKLLEETIFHLTSQLKILNKAVPELIYRYELQGGVVSPSVKPKKQEELSKINYKPSDLKEVSLVITEKDKEKFLENLRKSKLSINQLKKKYPSKNFTSGFTKSNFYAKLSNRIFRDFSYSLIDKGYFKNLNKNLRRINSRYVLGTYISMMLLTCIFVFIASILLFIVLLFFDISLLYPFITPAADSFYMRITKFFWVIPAFPIFSLLLFYFVPYSESKNLGKRIDQELPFVLIHMSAIASSGIEPVSIFKIIIKGEDYKYTSIEFKKLLNLINFQGESTANALSKISFSSPSPRLKDFLNGFATTITSGGDLRDFLKEKAETLLFDYKLERERSNKLSETFMDIYISIAIAAPMILLMIFVLIGSTGMLGNFLNLSINAITALLILLIVFLNLAFLIFLKVKQPVI